MILSSLNDSLPFSYLFPPSSLEILNTSFSFQALVTFLSKNILFSSFLDDSLLPFPQNVHPTYLTLPPTLVFSLFFHFSYSSIRLLRMKRFFSLILLGTRLITIRNLSSILLDSKLSSLLTLNLCCTSWHLSFLIYFSSSFSPLHLHCTFLSLFLFRSSFTILFFLFLLSLHSF